MTRPTRPMIRAARQPSAPLARAALAVALITALAACTGTGTGTGQDTREDARQDAGPATGPAVTTADRDRHPLPEPAPLSGSAASSAPATPPAPYAERQARMATRTLQEAAGNKMALPPPHIVRPELPHPRPAGVESSRERYGEIEENRVLRVAEAPVSTFSIDVDTGSWSNLRRMLNAGRLPPRDAIRVEELVNYFPYEDARPANGQPFAVHTRVARAPWNPERLVLRIGIKAEDKSVEQLPPANLVFLVDVSGSMASPDKLPLLKHSLNLLVQRLRPQDRISLVTYSSGTSTPLVAVPGDRKQKILDAIDSLRASGSTAGASGIEAAYRVAREGFIDGGINRILLATDGDFNVGVTDFRQLQEMVSDRRKSGISLSTLGFGTGNYNEHLMEQLADAGDGAYSYIDTLMEGQKVLVTEMSSTLATVARDVKIQVEFNPATVAEYRLIGYENRLLARDDFNNDKVDAGDVGAGHSVTALYELTPVGARSSVDPLRYGAGNAAAARPSPRSATDTPAAHREGQASELAFVRLRYKPVGAGLADAPSRLIEQPVTATISRLDGTDADFRFATAIAGFGQVLRNSRYTGTYTVADARALAAGALGGDPFGYRAEALRLMDLAAALQPVRQDAPATPR